MKINKESIEVLGTDGDHELGGKNWDDRIITYIAQKFEEEFSADPLADSIAFNDLIVKAENAKKQLSVRDSTTLTLTYGGEKGKYNLDIQTFETLTDDLLERTQLLTEKLLEDIQLDWNGVDGILLVGGSTRMPMVSRWITKMSGKTPLRGVNVDEAVALGAAIQANIDANGDSSPGLLSIGGVRKIVDVMSHSLGMVAENETRSLYLNSIIIPKNKAIPSEQTKPYQIRTKPGSNITIEVYMLQGESQKPLECDIIGKYVFSGVEHQAGGQAVLDITYAYDRNGVIKVSGQQRSTGRALDCVVEPIPVDVSWLGLPPVQATSTPEHLSVLLAIDLSGSMSGTPLFKAKEAARSFIQKLDLASTSIGLMQFADQVKVAQELCQNAKSLEKGIESWTIGDVGYGNSTEPFSSGLTILGKRKAPKFMVVLTDGIWSDQPKAIATAELCKENGIEIIAVGFGGADQKFLQRIATSDENAMLTNLNNLTDSFSKIAQVLTDSGGLSLRAKNSGIFAR